MMMMIMVMIMVVIKLKRYKAFLKTNNNIF